MAYDFSGLFEDAPEAQSMRAPTAQPVVPQPKGGYDFSGLFDGDTGQTAQLHSALFDAAFVNPDDYAKRRKLAGEMGYGEALLPPLPDAEALAWLKKNPADSMLNEAPALSSWLAQEDNAKLAKDDLPVLSSLGKMFAAGKRGWESASLQGELADLLYKEMNGSLNFAEQARRDKLKGDLAYNERQKEGQGTPDYLANVTAYSVRQLGSSLYAAGSGAGLGGAAGAAAGAAIGGVGAVPGAAAGLTAGALTASASYSYRQEAAFAYDEFRGMVDADGQALDPRLAKLAAQGVGTVNALIETTSDVMLAKLVPGFDQVVGKLGGDAAKRAMINATRDMLARPTTRQLVLGALSKMASGAAIEGLEEFTQAYVGFAGREAAQAASGKSFAPDSAGEDFASASSQAIDAAVGTFFTLSPVGGAHYVAGRGAVQRAQQNQVFFESLADAGQNSKLLARLPEKYRALVEHYTADGPLQHVFVEAQAFQTYFQEIGQDAQAIAAELGATDYSEALARGGDVAIPLGAFAEKIAPSDHLQGLMPDLKLQPWEMTPREAELAQANRDENERRLGEELAAATEAARSDTVLSEQIRKITDEVTGQLLTRYDQPTAEALSTVLRGVAVLGQREAQARAQTAGREATPEEIAGFIEGQWAKYGLTIRANPDLPAVLTQSPGFEANLDPLLDMLRRGERPTDADLFGESLTEFVRRAGGLQDLGGELSSRDADAGRRPFQKALIQPEGKTFDAMRELLAEAGFQVGESEAEFLDALDAELRGSPLYAGGRENAEAMQRRGDLDALAEALQALGLDLTTADNAAIKAALFPAASYDQPAKERLPRGQITIGANRQMRIDLLKDANLSTLLHEVGHFYLELLGDLAESEGASAQVQADYAAIMKWFGIENRGQITTEHHEMFARANEAYLMEGKAPSVELRSTFARFKAWLSLIYRELRRLNVSLSNEVREVFNRIYATDAEIREAQAQNAFVELFTTAEAMGVTQAEFGLYMAKAAGEIEVGDDRLRNKVMRVQRLKREAWWREALAEERKTVEAELDALKEYQAHAALTAKDAELKLDRADLVRRYGAGILKRLPRGYGEGRGAIYTAEGVAGSSVDVASELLGFASGDELVESLANLRPKAKVIAAEAARRLEERHGDLLNSVALADEAQAALHNGERGAKLAMELKALRKLQRIAEPIARAMERDQAQTERIGREVANDVPPLEVFREAARRTVAGKKVRDLRPNDYLLAERKANRKSFEALGKKDYAAAQAAKQQELLNFALFREATKTKEEVEKLRDYAKSFEKPAKQQKLGKAGTHYLEAAQALLENVDLANISGKAIDRQKLMRWLQEAEQSDLYVTEDMVAGTYATNWREMTVEQLRALGDSLKNLDHVAGRQLKIINFGKAMDFEQAVEAIKAQAAKSELKPLRHRRAGEEATIAEAVREVSYTTMRPETFIELLDGGEEGVFHDLLWNPAVEAENLSDRLKREIMIPLGDIVTNLPEDHEQRLNDPVHIKSLGRALRRYELIGIALNVGNASNRDKLLRGGIHFFQEGGREISEPMLQEMLAKLNRADWEMVQTIWATIDKLYPHLNELNQRLLGVPLPKIEALPFTVTLDNGETLNLAGGYWPAVADPMFSDVGKKQEEEGAKIGDFFPAPPGRVTTAHSFREARTEAAYPLSFDWRKILARHVNKASTDIAYAEFVKETSRLLKNNDVQQAITAKLGDEQYNGLTDWLKKQVSASMGGYVGAKSVDNVMSMALANLSVAALGYKVATAFGNALVAPMQAVHKVKGRYMVRGYQEWLFNPKATLAKVHALSEVMMNRSQHLDADYNAILDKLGGKPTWRKTMMMHAMAVHTVADTVGTTGLWLGKYYQEYERLAEGSKDPGAIAAAEREAARLADKMIRTTQTAGGAKDLSSFERDPKWKWASMFLGPMLVQQNGMRKSFITKKSMVMTMLATWILPAVFFELAVGRGPDDDEEYWQWALRKIALYPLQMVPLVREAASSVEAWITGESSFVRANPIAEVATAAVKFGRTLSSERADEGDKIAAGMQAAGLLTGFPGYAAGNATNYLTDLATDETDFNSPLDIRFLFIRRADDKND